MAVQKSMHRAILDGEINGPHWDVVDETGAIKLAGAQNFHPKTPRIGRAVMKDGNNPITYVIDYQFEADEFPFMKAALEASSQVLPGNELQGDAASAIMRLAFDTEVERAFQ